MRRDGGRFPAEATTSPIRDAEGEIAGFSLIARDITGRREAERAVRRLAAIVESSSDRSTPSSSTARCSRGTRARSARSVTGPPRSRGARS